MLVFCCLIRNCHQFSCLKQHSFLSLQPEVQGALLKVSQGRQGCSQGRVLPGGSEEEFTSSCAQVVGRIHFLCGSRTKMPIALLAARWGFQQLPMSLPMGLVLLQAGSKAPSLSSALIIFCHQSRKLSALKGSCDYGVSIWLMLGDVPLSK